MPKRAPAPASCPSPVWAIIADGELDQIAYTPRERDNEMRDLRAMGFNVRARQFESEAAVNAHQDSGRAW